MQRDEESAIFTRYKAFGIRGGKFLDWSAPHPHPHSLLTFVFSRSCCGVSKTTEEGDKNSEREPRVYWLRIWTATWILLNLGGRTLSMHSSSWLEPKGDSHTKSVASGQPRYPVIVYRTGPVSHFLPLLHLCGFRAGILCHSYSRIRLSTQLLVVSFSVCRFFGVSHYWGEEFAAQITRQTSHHISFSTYVYTYERCPIKPLLLPKFREAEKAGEFAFKLKLLTSQSLRRLILPKLTHIKWLRSAGLSFVSVLWCGFISDPLCNWTMIGSESSLWHWHWCHRKMHSAGCHL